MKPRQQCTTPEEEIARAQSDVSRAEADHVALHANAARLVNTDKARPGLIAQQELDDATAKDRASGAQVDAAKSALSAANQQLEVAKANQQHYSALIRLCPNHRSLRRRGDLALLRYRLALVQAGTSNTSGLPVVTVAQINVLRLRIPVPESIAAIVKIGDSADVHVQATGEHFTGKIARFTNSLDPSTRTMQVEIEVPNPTYRLQPGMYARVQLSAASRPNMLGCPDRGDPAQREQDQCARSGLAEPGPVSRCADRSSKLQRCRNRCRAFSRRARHRGQPRQLSARRVSAAKRSRTLCQQRGFGVMTNA